MTQSLYEWTPEGPRDIQRLVEQLDRYRLKGRLIVTGNGCFDLLHSGHIQYLSEAKLLGDILIVGINSDQSVEQLKGTGRPLLPQEDRANILAALSCIDHVVIFNDLLPNQFISLIRPDIHCKAGDYSAEGLPEAEVVIANGGRVHILPLLEGYSSSRLITRIQESISSQKIGLSQEVQEQGSRVSDFLFSSSNILRHVAYRLAPEILYAANLISEALDSGHKVLICGNGGSAADAQHFASELVGRFRRNRYPWPAIALTVDTSAITSISNDYGFEEVFARQVQGLGNESDVLIAMSTSGSSTNVIRAIEVARKMKITTIVLTGDSESPLGDNVDSCMRVPSYSTALIQQAHSAILHAICEIIESELAPGVPVKA